MALMLKKHFLLQLTEALVSLGWSDAFAPAGESRADPGRLIVESDCRSTRMGVRLFAPHPAEAPCSARGVHYGNVFADKAMTEPARHLADEAARAGRPTWLYRFSHVAESRRDHLKGAPHGFELPDPFDIAAAMVGGAVSAEDKSMGGLESGYWVTLAKVGDLNGEGRSASATPMATSRRTRSNGLNLTKGAFPVSYSSVRFDAIKVMFDVCKPVDNPGN